jgi:hypothetical protein
MLPKLKALWLLGTAFLIMLLRTRLRLGPRLGFQQFAENYGADGLVPMTPAQRTVLAEAQACFACGRCCRGDAAVFARSGAKYPGLMTLVLAGARGTPDFPSARAGWECLSDAELTEREKLCPVDVPLRRLRECVVVRSQGVQGA